MSVKIVHEIAEIKKRVMNQSIYISDPVGEASKNAMMRIADVIPITNQEEDIYLQFLYEVCPKVLESLGAYTEDIDYPYTITDDTDPEFPESIVYEIELNSNSKEGIALAILQQAISDSLIYYILDQWLRYKNYPSVFEAKYNEALGNIRTALLYGNKSRKQYKIM